MTVNDEDCLLILAIRNDQIDLVIYCEIFI
jgi:hypothetical protein